MKEEIGDFEAKTGSQNSNRIGKIFIRKSRGTRQAPGGLVNILNIHRVVFINNYWV